MQLFDSSLYRISFSLWSRSLLIKVDGIFRLNRAETCSAMSAFSGDTTRANARSQYARELKAQRLAEPGGTNDEYGFSTQSSLHHEHLAVAKTMLAQTAVNLPRGDRLFPIWSLVCRTIKASLTAHASIIRRASLPRVSDDARHGTRRTALPDCMVRLFPQRIEEGDDERQRPHHRIEFRIPYMCDCREPAPMLGSWTIRKLLRMHRRHHQVPAHNTGCRTTPALFKG